LVALFVTMPRHADWEIMVHFENVSANEIANKDDYFKAIEDRYTSNYCVELGVEPLPHHKAYIARQAPLKECEFEAGWTEGAAVASRLSIMQPNIRCSGESPKAIASLSDAQRNAQWFGRATHMSVSPPDPPPCAAHMDLGDENKAKVIAADRHMKQHAYMAMHLHDVKASSRNNLQALTSELERTRVRIRSDLEDHTEKANVFGKLLKKKGRQEANEKELENLKVKFLLPFAAERQGSSDLLPWQSPGLRTHPQIHVHEDFMEDALKPISLTIPQMEEECFAYAVMRFPVELLTTRADAELFAAIREQLVTEEAVRLIGLMSHFVYWIVLEHIHDESRRLPIQSKQSLVLTIQELWSLIQAPARQRLGRRGELLSKDGPAGISFVIPAFMLALKRGVEWCFETCHPWIFTEKQTSTQLVDQINLAFMRLFDPDCLYASFGALEASERAINLWHKLAVLQSSLGVTPARRMINQEFRTTPLMSLLMTSDGGNPGDPKTRVLLAKSSSESMINSSPQADGKAAEKVPLDDWRKSCLFRSAEKRLNGLQRAGKAATGGKSAATPDKKVAFMKSKSSLQIARNRSGTQTRSSEGCGSTIGSDSVSTIRF